MPGIMSIETIDFTDFDIGMYLLSHSVLSVLAVCPIGHKMYLWGISLWVVFFFVPEEIRKIKCNNPVNYNPQESRWVTVVPDTPVRCLAFVLYEYSIQSH